jgi:hypothetical protein
MKYNPKYPHTKYYSLDDVVVSATTKDGKNICLHYNGRWSGDIEMIHTNNAFMVVIDTLLAELMINA